MAHLAERTQSFLDVIKIFLGRCLQISFQQTTQGLVSSLATKGLLVFTPIQATLPTRFKKWKPRKLAKTLFPCVSDSIRATTCTAFWGGFGCQKVSKHFGVLLSYQNFQTSLIFTSPYFGPWETFQPKVSQQSEALAVFSSASNFSRCALRLCRLHKEILDILELQDPRLTHVTIIYI